MSAFEEEVLRVVAMLGEGEVVSYGDVAHVAGRPGAHRAVGRIMSTRGDEVPWWRVVYADGGLPAAKPPHQVQLLRAEGVLVREGRVIEARIGRFAR
ncbi:MAG: MGMT family protein [Actinomycetota bacterium]|nr:MGMT family protein [Actinomycetota bacterium]